MRQYRIDELTADDVARVGALLQAMDLAAGIDGVYWLPVPPELLTPVQREHAAQCGPYVLTLETAADAVTLELLVRGRGRLRCACVQYASPAVQAHMIDYVDTLLRQLSIAF